MSEHSNDTAPLPMKEYFFDRLEAYFDFRHSSLPASPTVVADLARQLARACGTVERHVGRVDNETHRMMIAQIVDNAFRVKEWQSDGCKLNHAARILLWALRPVLDGEAA